MQLRHRYLGRWIEVVDVESYVSLLSRATPVSGIGVVAVTGGMVIVARTRRAVVQIGESLGAPRWVSTRTQPVALPDVIADLAGVCGPEPALGAEYDVGGPEVMTYREMMEKIARLRGKHPFILEVPVLTPYLSSLWLHVVTPVKAGIARPLIEACEPRLSFATTESAGSCRAS